MAKCKEFNVKYPYRGKKVTLTKDVISSIDILENINARYVPSHTQINVRMNKGKSVYLNSLEIKNFSKLKAFIIKDFKSLIVIKKYPL